MKPGKALVCIVLSLTASCLSTVAAVQELAPTLFRPPFSSDSLIADHGFAGRKFYLKQPAPPEEVKKNLQAARDARDLLNSGGTGGTTASARNATAINGFFAGLFNQGKPWTRPLPRPSMARADLFANADATRRVGAVLFFQYSSVHPLTVITNFASLAGVPANGAGRVMEVRLNPAGTIGAGVCLNSVVGAVFNATGKPNSGVLSRDVTIEGGVGSASALNLDTSTATLFQPASIIGRSVKIFAPGTDDQAVCGNIVAV